MRMLINGIYVIIKIYYYIINYKSLFMSLLFFLYKLFTDPFIYFAILINKPEADTFNKNLVANNVLTYTFFDLFLFPLLLSSSKTYTSLFIYKSDIKILDTSI